MGQILHGSAKTTHVVRAAIQRSKASIKELAGRYDLNPKTVTKWKKRAFVHDAPMGPKAPHSTVLSAEEEALAVAFATHGYRRLLLVARLADLDIFAFAGATLRGGMIGSNTKFSRPLPRCSVVLPP